MILKINYDIIENNKSNMANKRKGTTKKGRSAQEQQLQDMERERKMHNEELRKARQEAEELKELVNKLRSDNQKFVYRRNVGQQDKIDVTLQANVISTTRKIIYPKCPYISTEAQLMKCTKIVGKKMSIPSEQLDSFISLYKNTVNSAIATRRNANIQQVRKKLDGK